MPSPRKRKTSGRRVGKPGKDKNLIGPAELILIAELHLQHVSQETIAAKVGVSPTTIKHHLDTTIKPLWQYGIERLAEHELCRIDLVERIAWERFHAASESGDETVSLKDALTKEAMPDGQQIEHLKTVERATTRSNKATGALGWMGIVQWCISERSRIKGHYAANRLNIEHGGDIRVAGKTREDIDQELAERIAFVLESAARRKQLADAYVARSAQN